MSKLITPVTHELTTVHHVPTLSLYHLLIQVYTSKKHNVDDKGKQYIPFNIQNKEFSFYSSLNGFLIPGTDKQSNKYHLKCGDEHSPQKITITLKPMFGEGTITKYGKVNNIKKISTDIIIQSSYYDLQEQMSILHDFLKQIEGERFYGMIDLKESQIQQFERCIRYDDKKEPAVGRVFHICSEMLPTKDATQKTIKGAIYQHILYPDNYDFLGFDFPYHVALKTYRFDDFQNRCEDDPLHHPKLGVHISKSKQYPRASEYETVKAQLDELLLNIIHFSGLTDDDFIEDDYFKKVFEERIIDFRPWLPIGYERIQETNLEIKRNISIVTHSPTRLLTLYAICSYGEITLNRLSKYLKIPFRTIQRHVSFFKEKGMIDTLNSAETYVFVKSELIRKALKSELERLDYMFDIIGIKTLYGDKFIDVNYTSIEDTILKEQPKEDHTDLKHLLKKPRLKLIGESIKDILLVGSRKEASELSKELKSQGIKKQIGICNNYIPQA